MDHCCFSLLHFPSCGCNTFHCVWIRCVCLRWIVSAPSLGIFTGHTLRTNGALKDLIGSFTLSQIQDHIWFFRGPLSRVPRRTPMLWCSEVPLRCFRAPCIRFFEAPLVVALGHPVLNCIPLRDIYSYDLWVLQGTHLELVVLRGTSGALRDITQFGVLCSVIGWVYLWCYRCII